MTFGWSASSQTASAPAFIDRQPRAKVQRGRCIFPAAFDGGGYQSECAFHIRLGQGIDLHDQSDRELAAVLAESQGPAQVAAYRRFLFDYSAQQKSQGRFERPPTDAKLYSLPGWMEQQHLVPGDVRLQSWLALGFLFVCMVNIVALLLAKFMRRSAEISVRVGAGGRRMNVFVQFGLEPALIGVAGGALGLAIAEFGLWSVRQRPDDYAHLARMDGSMLLGTFALAVVVSVLAGLLPAWRACRIPPALQLKTL